MRVPPSPCRVRAIGLALGISAFLFGSPFVSEGQSTGNVRGTAVDSSGGLAILGASITVVGTRLGAVTDNQGSYIIRSVPVGQQTIRFARIGYGPQTRVVTVSAGGET